MDTLEMHAGDVLDAGAGLSSYLWNTGDTTESIVVNAEGMYSVEMESPVGCIGSDSVFVKLVSEEIPDFEIYMPNAFSPNGDGLNDIFKAVYKHDYISKYYLSIYNRWGQIIFECNDIDCGWDGTYKGKPSPNGAYIYQVVYEGINQQSSTPKTINGMVVLVK